MAVPPFDTVMTAIRENVGSASRHQARVEQVRAPSIQHIVSIMDVAVQGFDTVLNCKRSQLSTAANVHDHVCFR